MKLILVPTDFSENANTAIEYGCELASAISGEILIVHFYPQAKANDPGVASLIQEESKNAKSQIKEKLAVIKTTIGEQYPDLPCSCEFRTGSVRHGIESLVESRKVHMVVMGTQGASGVDRVLFGSNAAEVIENVSCPVLAVPPESPYHVPKKIVYATDFNEKELKKIVGIISVASAFDAELIFLHITTDRNALLSEEMLKRNFAKRINEIYDYDKISFLVKYHEHVDKALELIVAEVGADWIVLLTHRRTFFEKLYDPSLAKRLAYHSSVPLLAIK